MCTILFNAEIIQTTNKTVHTKMGLDNAGIPCVADTPNKLILKFIGYRNIEPNSNFILEKITDSDGFIAINDKSSPEIIKDKFQMSKKSFKKSSRWFI